MWRPSSPSPPIASPHPNDLAVGESLTAQSRRTSRASAGRRTVLAAILVGALWMAVGIAARPIDQTCDPALTRNVCLETIDAAQRRGLPAVHPLLLAAHAAPGPAARPDQFGHRATVRFTVLGVPGPVIVRLFFDAGGHWDGIADRQAPEMTAWTIGWAIAAGIAVAVAAGGLGWLARGSRSTQ